MAIPGRWDAFPRCLCIIVVVIFSSIVMKNVFLAHENSIAVANHSVPEWEGLHLPTNKGHLHAPTFPPGED